MCIRDSLCPAAGIPPRRRLSSPRRGGDSEKTGFTGGAGGGGITLDVSGAKTQSEAYELITKQLMAQGKTVGSKEFDEDMRKVWQENSINKLPER